MHTLRLLSFLLISTFVFIACDDDDDNSTQPAEEFVAEYSDFDGYRNWTMTEENVGPDPLLKGAHGDNDTTTRRTYINDSDPRITGGEYPVGTILVKDVFNKDETLNSVVAMVKRGGSDFNSDHNGWEWFLLNRDEQSIEGRGADLMNGACNGCHTAAETDYVFTR